MIQREELGDNFWRASLIGENASIEEAINTLEQCGLKIVLVINQSGVLMGTISDGDIRRGLVKGIALGDSVNSILCRSPIISRQNDSRASVLDLMIKHKIFQIPIVNSSNQVVGLCLRDFLKQNKIRNNLMVIMAGGKGLRLRPYTENTPKPLLLVQGRPMLERILMRAIEEGFRNFVFVVNYLGEKIEDYFGDGERFGVEIQYLKEGQELGTAGGISLLSNKPEIPFVVSNADVLTDLKYGDLLDFHLEQNAIATMVLRSHEWQNPYGVVITDGFDIKGFEEKPIYKSNINAGIYVLDPAVFNYLERNVYCDMPQLFEKIRAVKGRAIAYPIHEDWADIGRIEDLHRFA